MAFIIEKHDPAWSTKFETEANVVREVFGAVMSAIHHIGSTAIPNICAKPIIDMLVEVESLDALDERTSIIEGEGYEALGEFGIPGRRYFRKDNSTGKREYQIHAFVADSLELDRHIAFRDYLRSHSSIAKEYSDLKVRLAKQHPSDLEAYINGKDPFIKSTEKAALAWWSST